MIIVPYLAAAVQTSAADLSGVLSHLDPDVKLAVLPLAGVPGGHRRLTRADVERAASSAVPEALVAAARAAELYVVASYWEENRNHTFLTGVLIDPKGLVVARQRQLFAVEHWDSGFSHDEEPFVVTDTPLGRIGIVVGDDLTTFETGRCLAMRGAEVLCHVAGEGWTDLADGLTEAKVATAAQCQSYVVSANAAGGSRILDFTGKTVAAVPGMGETAVVGSLDIERLRSEKSHGASIAMNNSPLYAEMYERLANPVADPTPSALPYA